MQTSPLFLNMTRWGADYGPSGGVWGPNRVNPTVAQVETALGLAPNALTRLVPAHGTSRDLVFIPVATRGNCGLGPALFANPVGREDGVAGANGQCRLDQLRCAMNGVWPALPDPVLGIIDSDAAHHMSLLLAERAFAAVPAGHARIVINFDAHTDFSNPPDVASLRCDNWGSFTVNAVPPVYANPIADVYVMIGNKVQGLRAPNPPWSNTIARFRVPGPAGGVPAAAQPVAGATIAQQIQQLIVMLNGYAAAMNNGNVWAGYAVYVTVDRDVQESSYTDYGDGAYTVAAVWQAVDDCLTELDNNNVAFAGFDICGLPTYAGKSNVSGGLQPAGRIALACANVTTFHNRITALLPADPGYPDRISS
jgi:hypothetical protein